VGEVDSEGACCADTILMLAFASFFDTNPIAGTYAKPSKNTAANPIFCLMGNRSLNTTNMGSMQARKS
jgi:hypothetical protein